MKKTKRIQSFLMAMVMLLSTVAFAGADIQKASAASTFTLNLYYNRADGNYSSWNVWAWPEGLDGAAYYFDREEEYDGKTWQVTTIEVPVGTSQVGYIVRKGEWLEKDVDADQFISTIDYADGVVNYYVSSGKKGGEIDDQNALKGCVITGASLDTNDCTKINVSFNIYPVGKDQDFSDFAKGISVTDGKGNLCEISSIDAMAEGSLTTVINLKEAVSVKNATMENSTYSVVFEDNKYSVKLPDYYSSVEFEKDYTYSGDDLGSTWTKDATTFKVWAPTAESVNVVMYTEGQKDAGEVIKKAPMTLGENGVWSVVEAGDLNGVYYTYEVTFPDGSVNEACDPYARTVGVNGDRAMVIDLDSTNPEGWDKDVNPYFGSGINYTDCSIWEVQVRDFSYDAESGVSEANRGKYLGFTERGTKNSSGEPTCLDYLENLGVTHVQINPAYDFATVDETALDRDQYNWGYDPKNYNSPDGSFSSNPYDGAVRVKEFKQMVQSLHGAGIGVIMDVVYNHTYNTDYCFNKIVPGYCYRGSNASGCGNDVASERAMMSKFIVESVLYWHNEYHIDGFRFDLVGIIDVDTINELTTKLHEIDPSIILYGEGWTLGGAMVTKEDSLLATQGNANLTPGFGYFNDFIRDALKGSVFTAEEPGYVNGALGRASDITSCAKGAASWSGLESNPSQMIQYSSCHDNYTLWDKIASSNGSDSFDERVKQNNLAAAITFTSQGIPFILAGEEMLRTKVKEDGTFDHNSYASPSKENSIKWGDLSIEKYKAVNDYYKGLIALRNAHPAFRMASGSQVDKCIEDIDTSYIREVGKNESGDLTLLVGGVVAYSITGCENDDDMVVIYNPNKKAVTVNNLPDGVWNVCVQGNKAGTETLATVADSVKVDAVSTTVLVKGEATDLSKTAKVSGISNKTYTGKSITQSVTVKNGSKTLKKGTDYSVSYSNNKNAGTAKVKITFKGLYKGTITKSFKIAQAAQKISVKSSVSKKANAKAFSLGAKVSKGDGKLSYKSANTKIAKVNSSGKVTLTGKKGTVKITVTAKATKNYKKATATVTIKVK